MFSRVTTSNDRLLGCKPRLAMRAVTASGRLAVWVGLLGVAAAGGCGAAEQKRVPVAGQVLLDGTPLTTGYVQIVPQGARASGAPIEATGKFSLTCYAPPGAAGPGRCRVGVLAVEEIAPDGRRWLAPTKYADPRTSGLEVDIPGPTENLTINLTWDGGAPFVEQLSVE